MGTNTDDLDLVDIGFFDVPGIIGDWKVDEEGKFPGDILQKVFMCFYCIKKQA